MALFWLRTSYHAQRYMFQRYILRSLLTQSFNIVHSPIILLFTKKWVPGFAAEDNTITSITQNPQSDHQIQTDRQPNGEKSSISQTDSQNRQIQHSNKER